MISIVIPHYDDVELLSKNLPRLVQMLGENGGEWEVIVADDSSPKGAQVGLNQLILKLANERVRLLIKSKNTGFGPTVNKAVFEAKGEIVFVLKVDVLPKERGYFKEILDNFKDKKAVPAGRQVFAVSSALESVEDSKKEIRGQGIVLFFRGLFMHFRTKNDYQGWLLTNRSTKHLARKKIHGSLSAGELISAWPDGGSSAYRRDIFLKLGGFDSLFAPFYWEDTDLGYRAWKAGYEVRFAPKAVLVHNYREGSIRRYHSSRFLKILNLRNQWLFVGVNSDLGTFLQAVLWSFYHLAVAAKNGNWDLFKALFWAKLKLFEVLRARFERGKYFVKTDEEVLKIFEEI